MDKPGEMSAFVRVVEEGGFSAAARSLRLTPSAVSKLIGRLEDRLGVRLLHRTTRQINPTHEGVAFYQRCVRILKEIEEAEQAISALHEAPRGLLRVTAAVAFADHQIVPLLPEFLDRYPEVRIELTVTDRVVDLIEEGFDVAVRVNVRADSRLIARLLVEDRRIICAAPAYLRRHGVPKVPGDLSRHNCLAWIGDQGGLNHWPFDGPDGPYSLAVNSTIEVNSGETLYAMVRAGLGIARLAELVVGRDIRTGGLVPLLTDHYRADALTIHAVYPHRRHLLPKVRAFVDFLISKFTPEPPWAVARDAGEREPAEVPRRS
jgi:DNA-binding transcriptional LysR family regulator